MKRTGMWLAVGLIAMVGCSKQGDDLPAIGRKVVIEATMEDGGARAAVENGKVLWQEGDAISVMTTAGTMARGVLSEGAGTDAGKFTVTLIDGQDLSYPTYGFYPAGAHGADSFNLPSSYTVTDMENTNAPMKIALVSGPTGVFEHLGGVIRFTLRGIPAGASQVTYTTLDGKNITGDFELTEVDGKKVVAATDGSGTNSSVTINFPATTEKGEIVINIPMPVGSYRGIELDVKNSEGTKLVQTISYANASNTVTRTKRVVMPALTVVVIEGTTEGVVTNDAELRTALKSGQSTIELAAGSYAKAHLSPVEVSPISGTGTQDDPYFFKRTTESLTIEGSADAKVEGFEIDCGGLRVSYRDGANTGFNPELGVSAHPSYYYMKYVQEIGTLAIKDITLTKKFIISDTSNSATIGSLIFDGVTFDMAGVTESAAAHIIEQNNNIGNIIFRNCKFVNCKAIEKPIAIDMRTTVTTNITVDGCSFDAAHFNAMQISGNGANFAGPITITNNEINNTLDRGVRISTVSGELTITDNTLINAADIDGEAMKWGGTPTTLTFENNTLYGKELVVYGVVAKVQPIVSTWDGTYVIDATSDNRQMPDTFVVDPTTKTITIKDAAAFAYLATYDMNWDVEGYNSYYYKWSWEVRLDVDIDLDNKPWNPLNIGDYKLFDGQKHTIYNLNVNVPDLECVGLFSKRINVQNVKVENATVVGKENVGVVLGYDGGCNNVHVKNISVTGAKYVGGIIGKVAASDVLNCSVIGKNNTITCLAGGKEVGGVVGFMQVDGIPTEVSVINCHVENAVVTGPEEVGGVIGRAYARIVDGTQTIVTVRNCSTKNVTVTATTNKYFGDIIGNNYINSSGVTLDGKHYLVATSTSELSSALNTLAIASDAVLYLCPGNYDYIEVKNGMAKSNVQIIGKQGATVNGIWFQTHIQSMTNVTIDGITFDGGTNDAQVYGVYVGDLPVYGLTVKNCVFKNAGTGVSVVGGTPIRNVVVENCTFEKSGTLGEGSSAVYFQTIESFTIRNNTFNRVCYNAIQANTLITGDVTITDNTFGTIGSRNIYLNGVKDSYAGKLTITGNTFHTPVIPKEDGNFVKLGTTTPVVLTGTNNGTMDSANPATYYYSGLSFN